MWFPAGAQRAQLSFGLMLPEKESRPKKLPKKGSTRIQEGIDAGSNFVKGL